MISSLRRVFTKVFYCLPFKGVLKSLYWRLASFVARSVAKFTPTKMHIKRRFKREFGYKLNLSNPKTFNEKIQWKKIYDHDSLYTRCADKYLVRDYVAERIGHEFLIPMLHATKDPHTIYDHILPPAVVLKSNNASGQIYFTKDFQREDKEKILKMCKQWLKRDYAREKKEWQYKDIEPRILVEEYLFDEHGNAPLDFRFHCFGGCVEFIQVDRDTFGNHKRAYFDSDWNKLPFIYCQYDGNRPRFGELDFVKKPTQLKQMLDIAQELSTDFDYVRIDLYQPKERVFFGEMTFFDAGGFKHFEPRKWADYYGQKINLSKFPD
jgi:hypothetical protein